MCRLQEGFGVSERFACRVAGQHRSTQRKPRAPRPIDDGELRAELRAIGKAHPRWGYKMATRIVRREGWHVNRKRVQRLWREEGLKRPPQGRKRRRVRLDTAERMTALRPNHVWAIDFCFDETTDQRRLKVANIVDECTREALTVRVGRHCTVPLDNLGSFALARTLSLAIRHPARLYCGSSRQSLIVYTPVLMLPRASS